MSHRAPISSNPPSLGTIGPYELFSSIKVSTSYEVFLAHVLPKYEYPSALDAPDDLQQISTKRKTTNATATATTTVSRKKPSMGSEEESEDEDDDALSPCPLPPSLVPESTGSASSTPSIGFDPAFNNTRPTSPYVSLIVKKCHGIVSVENEIRIRKRLMHCLHVVPTLDVLYALSGASVYTVSPRSLPLTKLKDKLSEKDIQPLFRQLLFGIYGMHDSGIFHLCLTPDDLMCSKSKDGSLHLRIGGYSRMQEVSVMEAALKDGKYSVSSNSNSLSASQIFYKAPELMQAQYARCYGTSYWHVMDMWTAGILLYVMFRGELPFRRSDADLSKMYQKIARGDFWDDATSEGGSSIAIPAVAQDLLSKLLVVDPAKRMTLLEAFQHPFVNVPVRPTMGRLTDWSLIPQGLIPADVIGVMFSFTTEIDPALYKKY